MSFLMEMPWVFSEVGREFLYPMRKGSVTTILIGSMAYSVAGYDAWLIGKDFEGR
jgi:hypothetical protein